MDVPPPNPNITWRERRGFPGHLVVPPRGGGYSLSARCSLLISFGKRKIAVSQPFSWRRTKTIAKMSIFPKISLRLEVERYLKEGFMNKEVVSALGKQEAERRFEALLHHLSHPPSFTTVRVNTHLASVQHVKNLLLDELRKQFNGLSVPVLQHPDLQDVLLIPVLGPRRNIKTQQGEAVVGAQCGNAVLRGAHVYVPGIVSASKCKYDV